MRKRIKVVTIDDTRDVSIRILEYLISNKYITERLDYGKWNFEIQDVIQEEINNLVNISEENEKIIITKQ